MTEPVKIGLIAALNTPQQTDQSPAVASARAAARAINAVGGIAGRAIDIIAASDDYCLKGAATAAHRMVGENVIAVTGSSIFDAGIQPVLAAAGVAQVGWSPNTVHAYTGTNEYLLNAGSMFELYGATYCAVSRGARRVYVLHIDVPALARVVDVITAASAPVGYRVVASRAVSPDVADLAEEVERFARSGADCIVLAVNSVVAVRFVIAALAAGVRGCVYAYTPADLGPAQIAELGAAAADFVLTSSLPPLTATGVPGIARFHEQLAAELAAGNADAEPAVQTNVTLLAWLAVHAVARVAQHGTTQSASVTAGGLREALDSAVDVDLMGVIPPWTPARRGRAPYDRISNPMLREVYIDGGAFRLRPQAAFDVRAAMRL